MSKYTPGPWKCDAASFTDSDAVAYEVSADGMTISAANAWLIAAAPDMAEALSSLLVRFGKYIDRRVPDEGPDWEFSKLWKEIEKARAALAKAGL